MTLRCGGLHGCFDYISDGHLKINVWGGGNLVSSPKDGKSTTLWLIKWSGSKLCILGFMKLQQTKNLQGNRTPSSKHIIRG